MSEKIKCFFSGEDAKRELVPGSDTYLYQSDGCGIYHIENETLEGKYEIPDYVLLNCASETIQLNQIALRPHWAYQVGKDINPPNEKISPRSIKDYIDVPILHADKSGDILLLISQKLSKKKPFSHTGFELKDMYKLKISGKLEFFKWITPLHENGCILLSKEIQDCIKNGERYDSQAAKALFFKGALQLTPYGWQKIEEAGALSKTAFIAMAFTDNNKSKLDPGLRSALKDVCSSLGWDPKIVDEEEHNDGIMDKVMALINKSNFVIAELTHQKTGVYYEAGYAKGKGLPVIHVVSKEDRSKCHFDVKHLNLVVYENFDDLKTRLSNRIEATVGSRV